VTTGQPASTGASVPVPMLPSMPNHAEQPSIVIRERGAYCVAEFEQRDWSCSPCSDRGGTLVRDEHGYEVFAPCSCTQTRRRLELFNQARIGVRYINATLESYEPKTSDQVSAKRQALDFTKMYPGVNGGLVFWGGVGTGKTHLAVGIFRELTLRKGVGCRFVDYGNLLQDLKRAFSSREGDAPVMLPLVNVELLVIDELGKGRNTDWEETVLDDLISRRYNAGRTTLCTTNFAASHGGRDAGQSSLNPSYQARGGFIGGGGEQSYLEDRVGVRIFSRLCEMCEFVRLTGSDFRKTSQGISRIR